MTQEAGGVRIVHDSARSSVVVVPNMGRPLERPRMCVSCQSAHPVKTYHINVNADGAAIVSPGVYRGLCQAGAFGAGFRVDAFVAEPPKQVLGVNNGRFRELKSRDKIALWHE